ncbi:MAG: D-tyrosyl-tRNA(Tyr) deacylase [Clostridia bacterium]|jgi:D-tyrosyl-tRNA(Tyr) deacylase|nr:D-tyrosyl-tRNA(Tyr) deacylase [Clostridia bacterium]
MKAVIQRVFKASVVADGNSAGSGDYGLLVLLGVVAGDTEEQATLLAKKIAQLRIFCDDEGKMNRSIVDIGGQAVVVSNFTLAADMKKGTRPSFDKAMPPQEADRLYKFFVGELAAYGIHTETGVFGAKMVIDMQCDGPVTLIMDTDIWRKA